MAFTADVLQFLNLFSGTMMTGVVVLLSGQLIGAVSIALIEAISLSPRNDQANNKSPNKNCVLLVIATISITIHYATTAALYTHCNKAANPLTASIAGSTVILASAAITVAASVIVVAKARAVLNVATNFIARNCIILKKLTCSQDEAKKWATFVILAIACLVSGLFLGASDVLNLAWAKSALS